MTSKIICVDASFILRLINSDSEQSPFMILWEQWQTEKYSIVAPKLFYYEITNALHRYVLAGQLQLNAAQQNLKDSFNLEITIYGDLFLHEQALFLANSLRLSAER